MLYHGLINSNDTSKLTDKHIEIISSNILSSLNLSCPKGKSTNLIWRTVFWIPFNVDVNFLFCFPLSDAITI